MFIRSLSVILLCTCISNLVGCGDGLSSLNGHVTIDGQPAPAGVELEFAPVGPTGSSSYASTDASGSYEANFTFQKTGILAGEHSVRLVPGGSPIGPSTMPVIGPDGKPVAEMNAPERPKFPEHYFQEIQRITIESGSNQIDIPLTTASATDP